MLVSQHRIFTNPILYVLFVLVIGIYWISTTQSAASIPSWQKVVQAVTPARFTEQIPIEGNVIDHPIKQLHEAATAKFHALLSRQSQTLSAAVGEYERRYGRPPPPGFDEWYEFAKGKSSVIIDDFDLINEAIEPFWKVEPRILQDILGEQWDKAPVMQHLILQDGEFYPSEGDWMGERIRDTLGMVSKKLPNMQLLINPLDEPRVILAEPLQTDEVVWEDKGRQASYGRIVEPCGNIKKKGHERTRIDTQGLPFITDLWDAQDVCQNPAYESTHGFMIAPMSFITSASPVPVFSQAIVSTFSDIIYPSMWYWDHEIRNLSNSDYPWKVKKNKLYWVGRTTGGFMKAHEPGEPVWESHRHRFIKITKQIGQAIWSYLTRNSKTPGWAKYESDEVLSQLYATKFTQIVQCEGEHCEAAKKEYQIEPAEDGMRAYENKFLMDLDGNSFSGRFYNLLASNSCPLKQTIFREWHDERLFPWVHYIPISVGMEELPETMRYLALTTEGSNIAQVVAHTGREWNKVMLRRDDAAVYLYRLFLEYARVMSEDRDSMNLVINP